MGLSLLYSPATQDLDVDECVDWGQGLDQLALYYVVDMDENPLLRE